MALPTQQEQDAFDLDRVDALDEMEFAVKHPKTEEPTTWVWTFYGPGHARTVELANRVSRNALRELQEQKQARLNGKKVKVEEQTLDGLRSETVDHILVRTKTFTPVKLGGETITFSEDAARQLLLDRRKGWLYKQITEYLGSDEKFYSALREELRAFARHEFSIGANENGSPYREVLEGLLARAKTEAVRGDQAELYGPPMPRALGYLWSAFARLRRRKGANGFAISPIEWGDIDAFNRLSGTRLVPWEISVLEELDDMFLAEHNKPRPGNS